jgi:hypothetical protein
MKCPAWGTARRTFQLIKAKWRGNRHAIHRPEIRIKRGFSTASTSEFTGLRGFSRRSGGMMGWATRIHIVSATNPPKEWGAEILEASLSDQERGCHED